MEVSECRISKARINQPEKPRKRSSDIQLKNRESPAHILDNIGDGVFGINPGGYLDFANKVLMESRGIPPGHYQTLHYLNLIDPEYHDQAEKNFRRVMGGRRGIPMELKYTDAGGSIRIAEVCSQPIREGGRVVGLLGTSRDITERKRAEQEVAILAGIARLISSTLDINEVYERFALEVRTLISCDRISIDLNNLAEGTFTVAYVSGVDIPGRRPGDTVPRKGSITEIILRTRTGLLLNNATLEEMNKLFPGTDNITTDRAGLLSVISVPLIARDEVIGTLHLRARKANAYTERDLLLAEKIGMQIAGAIANAQLYSGLAKVEADLRGKEEQLRILSNNIPGGLVYQVDTGEDGKERSLAYISEGVERLHGVTVSEALNDAKFIYGQVIEDDRQLLSEMEASAIANVSTFRAEVRRRSPSGDVRWSLFSSAPRRLPNNHLVWDGIEIDITERKQAEDALKETLDQLESRVRERTIELEETNTALRVLIKQGDRDQKAWRKTCSPMSINSSCPYYPS